jgi:hypothetical protein
VVVLPKSRLPYKIMIGVITDATHDSKPVTAPFAPLGVSASAMSSTFYITKKYQRLRAMTNNKLGRFSTSILVITLIVVVMFSPLTALSTSQARLFVGSGFPNADIRGPRIMDLQQFFPPSCTQFPNCTAAPSVTKNQSTTITLAKNSSSTATIAPKISSPSLLPTKFVRGNITRFGNSLYFGPYPTDDEFQLLKKNGFNVFVSLLTPKVPTDIPWIKKEQAFGINNNVTVVNFPLSPVVTQNSKADVDKIVKFVESFKPDKRIYIHDFLGKERDLQVYQAMTSGIQK